MVGKNIAVTLIVVLAIAVAVLQFPPGTWTPIQTVGLSVLVAEFVLGTIARFQLGNSSTASAQPKRLVSSGLYSKIRNPIYVFGSCVLAGLILLLGRPIWLVIFILLIPLQIWRARKESQVLEAKFGEEYRKYRSATWF